LGDQLAGRLENGKAGVLIISGGFNLRMISVMFFG
jgi:hypothetical protein